MSTDTVEEQPVGSIAEDLAAAFDESEMTVEPTETPLTEKLAEGEATDSDKPSDVVGPESTEQPAEELLSAPEHWADADKEVFSNAPRDIQEWALRRHKEMEGDYTRKNQERADFVRAWEPVQELYAPHVDQLRQIGLTPQEHIRRLANADLMLNQDPIRGIQHVAQMYNIDLSQLTGQQEEVETNPELNSLRQELAQLRNDISTQQQAADAAKHQSVLSNIEAFSGEKDAEGNPLRPYFDDVMEDLVNLARAERAGGREPDLNTLYERAVWANPEVRQKILAAEKAAEAKKADEEARAKAAKAERASASVSGEPGASVPTEDLDLREMIASQMS